MPNGHHSWIPRNLTLERDPDSDQLLSISHPASPYFVPWTAGDDAAALEQLLQIPALYLGMVAEELGLPDAVDTQSGLFTVNESAPRLKLSWLPIGSYKDPDVETTFADPRYSFWVRRRTENAVDRRAVFLAVPSLIPNNPTSALGGGLGLRINARVIERENADWLIGITGLSCSPGLVEMLAAGGPEISSDLAAFLGETESDAGFRSLAKAKLRAAFGLHDDAEIQLEGFRPLAGTGAEALVDIYANTPRPAHQLNAPAYAVVSRAVVSAGNVDLQSVSRIPLTAHQHLQEWLFNQDPASLAGTHTMVDARANRAPEDLIDFTEWATLPGLPAGPYPVALTDDRGEVVVRQSELLGGDPTATKTIAAPLDGDPRTDDFAALSGYTHARLLFDRMRNYGIDPQVYFKFAKFPLIVRYRATISPGPGKDGRTVNAAVDYDPPSSEFGQPKDETIDRRKPLQVRFALGDWRRSSSRREPLGIAADPRWAWHEFGHVLLAARTGGLELPFVHSVGDALAAIACDPRSRLATHQGGRFRGLTFPWAHIPRRHDRSPFHGWSWSGTFHQPWRMRDYTSNSQRKGYYSEQILSSSLFRLYRSLGGDTLDANDAPDVAARQRAAHYVIYLLMTAMESFPPATAGSVETPLQFIRALLDADCGTSLETDATLPLYNRVGGWARKVIEWAFEVQGFSQLLDEDAVNNAPGEPPEVDVFIESMRPTSEGSPGGYMPVSLDWHNPTPAPGDDSWLARQPEAMEIKNAKLRVRVHNRGRSKAEKVTVRAWYAQWTQPQPPAWDPAAWPVGAGNATWTELDPPKHDHDIDPGDSYQFPAFKDDLPKHQGRYLVLAAALCAKDEPNINADAWPELPTTIDSAPIIDLVAGDNNLGLVVYDV